MSIILSRELCNIDKGRRTHLAEDYTPWGIDEHNETDGQARFRCRMGSVGGEVERKGKRKESG